MFIIYLIIIILSLLPVSELRGAMIFGFSQNLPLFHLYLFSFLPNLLVAPLVFVFLDYFHHFFLRFPPYEKTFNHFLQRVRRKAHSRIERFGSLALIFFVAIPLPVTGAYTGTLAAWFFGLKRTKSYLAISLGVFLASLITFFSLLSGLRALEFIFSLDILLAQFIASFHWPSLLFVLAKFFDPSWLIVLLMIIFSFFVYSFSKQDKRYLWPMWLSLIFSYTLSVITKFIFHRPRPFGHLEYYTFTSFVNYSFPSSHAVFLFASLPFSFYFFPCKKMKYFFTFLFLFIALTRLIINVHYLSDVIFGALFGYCVSFYLLRWWQKNKTSSFSS